MALAGCSHLPSWMGGKKEEPTKIGGDRLAVLSENTPLTPDAALKSTAFVLPPSTNNADWAQHTGMLTATSSNLSFSGALDKSESARIAGGNDFEHTLIPRPVVAGGMVFAMDAVGEISAHDAANVSSTRWQSNGVAEEDEPDVYGGGLAYDQGKLYAVSGRGMVAAFDAATGKELWRKALRVPFRSAPRVDAGKLFALTIDSQFFALDAATGAVLWTHRGISETTGMMNSVSPAIASGTVIVPYGSGEIYALGEINGTPIWGDSLVQTAQTVGSNSFSGIGGDPIIDGEAVFAVSAGGRLGVFNLAGGQRLWDMPVASINTPWLAGDYLFVLSSDNTVAALVKYTGHVRWATKLPDFENEEKKKDPIVWRGPVLINGKLTVVGSNGQLLLISAADGTILETKSIPDKIYTAPVVAGGRMYLIDQSAMLYSLQ